jgi:hypothetical protein
MECNGINMTPKGQSTSIDDQSNWRSWGFICILHLKKDTLFFFMVGMALSNWGSCNISIFGRVETDFLL